MKTTPPADAVDPPSRLVRRLVGALAAGLLIVFWGLLALIAIPIALTPCRAEGSGCLGQAFLLGAVAGVVAVVAAWPVLYLLRVRPAWPVALIGPITLGGLGWLAIDGLGRGWALLPLLPSLSYGVGALAADAKVRWPWRVGIAVLVVAAYPLAPLLRDHRTDAGLQRYRRWEMRITTVPPWSWHRSAQSLRVASIAPPSSASTGPSVHHGIWSAFMRGVLCSRPPSRENVITQAGGTRGSRRRSRRRSTGTSRHQSRIEPSGAAARCGGGDLPGWAAATLSTSSSPIPGRVGGRT